MTKVVRVARSARDDRAGIAAAAGVQPGPGVPAAGRQVRRASYGARGRRSADARRARLRANQPAGDRPELGVLARRAALLLLGQGRPDHPLRQAVQGAVHPPVRPDRRHRRHRPGARRGVRRGPGRHRREDAPLHRLWYDLRSQSMFEDSLRADVLEIDDSLQRMVWRIVSRCSELAGTPLTITQPAAYAIFDGLFQRALLHHLAGSADALIALTNDVRHLLPQLVARPARSRAETVAFAGGRRHRQAWAERAGRMRRRAAARPYVERSAFAGFRFPA